MFRSRRSRLPVALLGAVAAVAGLSLAAAHQASSASASTGSTTPAAALAKGAPASSSMPAREVDTSDVRDPAGPRGPSTPHFARVGGVYLQLPANDVVVLGFHEAATRDPLALAPVGQVLDHQNTTKFDPPPPDGDGTPYVVLSSRGRPMPATSAADLVMRAGVPVRSPVDGEVTDVREYYLYGKHLDQRVEIAPAANPDLRVVMIHVEDVGVAVGDAVVAGETVVAAQARRFDFSSHIDRYTEPERHGHVHLEVKPAGVARPGDEVDDSEIAAEG